nr:hypothetical protein B0A51_04825 [Rachicladosporium sp. CCFEE 5018]
MSFFGFDTSLPRDQPPKASRGMFEQHDPFGKLDAGENGGDDDVLDFEQTYDGLGAQLNETHDGFNDDTFGDDQPVTRQALGRDFDFAGNTAKVRDTLLEEQMLHHARAPFQQAQAQAVAQQKPKKTGYEAYKQPDYLPKLEADANIWGSSVVKKGNAQAQQQPMQEAASTRKMMSLEEVEAMMREQAKPPAPRPAQDMEAQSQGLRAMLGVGSAAPPVQPHQPQQQQRGPQILQRPQPPPPQQQEQTPQPIPDYGTRAPQILQRQHTPSMPQPQPQGVQGQPPRPLSSNFQGPPQPMQFQQQQRQGPPPPHHQQGPMSHQRGPSYNGPPITQAQQMMDLSPADREAFMAEEARRAKRNHKIFLLSKNNGLMTPQDKNFITRIQLQQLLTATGGIDNDIGSEEQLAEDFYYQVYAQIRGPPRSGPGQPLNQFAQTYLFQTGGGRYGYGRSRHHPRGGDNHVQRMEQQVARAVEAAKARPKNKALVMEGSLGKIAFSNSKTPRPLLNLKRMDSEARSKTTAKPVTVADRKTALRDIENLYSTLMRMEDHERRLPPPPNEESPPEVIEGHMRWRSAMVELNQQLWAALKVMEPISTPPTASHPFIRLLSHAKGKKALPRTFRHLDDQQRLTLLTLLSIHLDVLSVVALAYPSADAAPLQPAVKAEIELFTSCVMPPLFSYVNEAPLGIIIGLLGLILERVNMPVVARTKVGLEVLTMLISRAELVKASTPPTSSDSQQWASLYNSLFDTLEPLLPYLFPYPLVLSGEGKSDVHVWRFLAAMGVGASPEQQQRLVLGVKERVMESVGLGREKGGEEGERVLGDVNLFMRSIGLDVELLG